jgi:hypothetical protein
MISMSYDNSHSYFLLMFNGKTKTNHTVKTVPKTNRKIDTSDMTAHFKL